LPERVGELGMPPTTIVDLRLELQSGNRSTLSRALRAALQHTVASGEQAIVYLNRRGFATVVLCRDCGFVAKCPACDIPYAYHVDGSLVCHRCGRREARAPERCPVCGSPRIRQLGVGTQRVEEEVRAAVPRAKVIRLDRDAVRAKGSHAAAYERMRSGDAQVIVGTQMLAKGFDLPRVTLVGVVNADTILNLPDFTAAERTFQLLTQVLGRSGRGEAGGRGIVQTYLPEHYAIRAAAAHDYVTFAEAELEGRRRFGYPPFGRLAVLSTQAKRQKSRKNKHRRDCASQKVRRGGSTRAGARSGLRPSSFQRMRSRSGRSATPCCMRRRRSPASVGPISKRSLPACSRRWWSRAALASRRRRSAWRSGSRSWTSTRPASSRSSRPSSGR